MPNMTNWLGDTTTNRAADAWARIQDKPTSITIRRDTATLSAQTVRLEVDSTVLQRNANVADVDEQRVVVFGVKGHATVTDTNIQRGDRFNHENYQYEVELLISQTGEVQAIARRIG